MDETDDVSDVFAIPDFWKSSTWLDSSAINLQPGGIFAVDVNSTFIEYIPAYAQFI
jgi:hypothetical protein